MSGEGPDSIPTSADPRSKRPVKKRALTPVSAQAATVTALFAKPEQEIRIPTGPPTKRTGPLPPEIVTNVQGSSAGAGSGEFHVYKAARRREYERLRLMDVEVSQEREAEEFERAKAEKESRDEEKTRRNREKREKMKARKEKAKQKGGKGGGGDGGDKQGATGGVKARVITKEGQDGEVEDKMDVDFKKEQPIPAAANVPGLMIHDDE